MPGFICRRCGQYHNDLPMSYDFPAPAYWADSFANDPSSQLQSEVCVIQDQFFFIKGNVEITLGTTGQIFNYTIWTTISKEHFQQTLKVWQNPRRVDLKPYPGEIANELVGYPNTIGLKVKIHTRKMGMRPFFELESVNHPLFMEQQKGVELLRVQEVAEQVIHIDG